MAVQHLPEAADVVLLVGSERFDADLYNGGRALALTGRHVGEALAATLGPEIVTLDSTRLAYATHVALPCERSRSWLASFGIGRARGECGPRFGRIKVSGAN